MSNQIVKALEHGAQKLGKTLAEDAGKALKGFYRKAGDNLKKVAHDTREADGKHAKDLEKILGGEKKGVPHQVHAGSGGGRGGRGKGERPLGRGSKRGQGVDGNIGCHTAGDPVDVVSGQMITSETDLALAGILPLVLRRAYASHYVGGRLFGPGWASTLDQRIEIDADGVHFAGDDAQILHYPHPDGSGRSTAPTGGARWPLTWEPQSGEMRIEDPDRGWTHHFPAAAAGAWRVGEIRPLAGLSDRNGHRIDFARDEAGLLTEIRHSGGYRVAVDTLPTEAGPRVEGLRLLDGTDHGRGTTVVGYQYYPDGNLAGIVNSSGLPYIYEYDDQSRITAWIDRNGESYEYAYDDSGRVVSGIGQHGILSAAFHYDTVAGVTTVTDSLGHTTQFHYDERHHVTATVDPLGHRTTTAYDDLGRPVSRTDEIGRTTLFDLDEHGAPVRITEPAGTVIELNYTQLGQIAAITQSGSPVAAFGYDANGNLLTTTDATGATTTRRYDPHGRLTAVTDPLGQTQHIDSNPAGLTTAVTDPLGHTTSATYDAFGRLATITDALGATTTLVRNTEGQVTERLHPDGTRESWEHDPEGNVLLQRDQAGATTRFTIGAFGRFAARTLPDGEEQHFEYDTELQLLAVSTNGARWQYRYDPAGHLVGESDFNDRTLTYRLDAADQLLQITDPAGRTTDFSYDLNGRLTGRRNHDGSLTTLAYDHRGCLTRTHNPHGILEYTHDAVGRVLTETTNGRTTTSTYDPLGRRTTRTTPTGIVSTWTYDANSRPATLTNPLSTLTFTHDAAGRETTRYLGTQAALTQTWDTQNRLTAQSIWAKDTTPDSSNPFTNQQERTYTYRPDGMPAAITDRLRGNRAFTLTPAGRVTRVSADSWNETYAYDGLGNITHAQDTRTPDSSTTGDRTYTGSLLRTAGRAAYEYDDRGRLVRRLVRTLSGQRRQWSYGWNEEDQLVRVDSPDHGSWEYGYDPLGRRTGKWRLGEDGHRTEAVAFAWDGVQLIEQHESAADGSRRTLTWDWQPGRSAPVAQSERAAGPGGTTVDEQFYAIVTDLVDTPTELVALDGRVVWTGDADLWGRRNHTDPRGCPLGRPGQYHDAESGLEYNHFRYYDPSTGRYLSTDPLGLDAGPNPHAYVPNPLYWIDPLGLAGTPRQPVGWGGSHYTLRPSNWTDGSDTNSYERNHIPARDSYVAIGGAKLGYGPGPAIRMDYDDHRDFISTGSSAEGIAWRAKQRSLIAQGKFDVAMKMDIGMIRKIHGTKYDAAIKEMVDSLPNNKSFQKYLSSHGWKIRTCLLK